MIGLYFYRKTKMNIDWNMLIAGFSAIAASAASIATFLGWKENRELRKAQTDPFVDVKLETVNHYLSFLRLKIMNIGKGGAFKLKITLKPHASLGEELHHIAQKVISVFNDLDYMNNGVNYLAPEDSKYTRYIHLASLSKLGIFIEDFFKLILIAEVQYYDLNKKFFKREYVIDTSEYNIYKLGQTFEESVPKSLESIQDSLKKINKNLDMQTDLLEKKLTAEELEWNEFELRCRLNQITLIKERNKMFGIENGKYNFKGLKRRETIHDLRKQNK